MSGTTKALVVAASIGAVVAFKDQGLRRWNYALMSLQQHAKANPASYYYLAKAKSGLSLSPSSSVPLCKVREVEKMQRRENSMKKVMHLSSWGPSTIRF